MTDETSYLCGNCGEEIVVPLDISLRGAQEYVEDCPVCCHPNLLHIEIDSDGQVSVGSELE